MAKKNESTSEKIVRLYKEGHSIDAISKLMEIPKGNIPNILEKHFPDYQNYVQPERPHDTESQKSGGGFGGLFGRSKNKKEDTADPAANAINLDMDEDGFIDRNVAGIASMLKKGRSTKDICQFFNCTASNVAAVSEVMEEHFKRKEAAEKAKKDAFKTGPDYEGPKVKESTDLLTGNTPEITKPSPVKPAPALEEKEYVPPVYDPVPENPTMDEIEIPDIDELTFGSDIPKTPVTANETEEEKEKILEERAPENYDIPAATPIEEEKAEEEKKDETKPEDKKEEAKPEDNKKTPAAEAKPDKKEENRAKIEFKPIPAYTPRKSAAAAPAAADEDTTDYNIEEDDSMTPMEKMKKFAELQIADNETKIADLEKKAVAAKASAASVATKVGEIEAQIAKLRAEADKIVADKVKAEAEAADIDAQIAALKKENDEFKSYIK